MAGKAYENQVLVINEGKVQKVGEEDTIEIGGGFTAGSLTTGGNISGVDATLSGDLSAVDATLSGDLSAVDVTASGDISAVDATLSGDLSAVGGTFSGNISAVDMTASGDLSAVDGTFSGDLSAVGATLSGNLSAVDVTASGDISAVDATLSGDLSAVGATLSGNLSAVDVTASGDISAVDATLSGDLSAVGATLSGNLSAVDGTFSGDISAVDATLSGDLSAVGITASGDISAVDATLSGDLSAVGATLSGNLSAVDGTFSGALSADNMSGSSLDISGNASIGGNLVVAGDIVSRGTVDLVVQDNFIDLNVGNLGGALLSGGWTVSMKTANDFTPVDVSEFTAGVEGVSAPTFAIDTGLDEFLFQLGDIVQLSGSSDGSNDGLFVVSDFDETTGIVTIKGIGGTLSTVPFIQNQFTTATDQTAKASKVDLAAYASNDGNLNDQVNTGILVYQYAAAAQEEAFGPTMWKTVGSDGVTLQNAYENGAGQIALNANTPLAIFPFNSEDMEGTNGYLEFGADSYLKTWGAKLEIGASGDAATGEGFIAKAQFNADGSYEISGSEDSTISVSGAEGTTLSISASDPEAETAASLEVRSGGQIYGTASSNISMTAGAGAAIIAKDSAVELKSIEAGAEPEHVYASLRLDNADGGTADLRAEGEINILSNGPARMKTVVDEVEVARVELRDDDSSAKIFAVELASIQGSDVAALVESEGAFKVQDFNEENPLDLFIVSADDDKTTVKQKAAFEKETGYDITAEAGVAKGEILCYTTNGAYEKQSNTQTPEVVGVATDAAGAQTMHSVFGLPVAMKFKSGEAPTMAGVPVYLSSTAGQATITAPTTSGRVYRLGVVLGAGADEDGLYKVLWMPAFVADL